ncbi:MAG: adenine phosphoribosyltransferase [Paludibacteraceae bacterium]|nr:adenine phosphoribosyltransferase [Paludibacteraceae bacterium]
MNIDLLKSHLRSIPDFPKPGILFRDVTTVFKSQECLNELSNSLSDYYKGKGITKVLGIESRGFIMGSIIANYIGAGFVPVRKPGKLPAEVISQEYTKEYGTDTVEIHKDALSSDDIVLIHDDLLATGGTMRAAYDLCKKLGIKKIYINCIIELTDLKGRKQLPEDVDVYCPICYEGE